jgi:uncharacterized membrane protein
VKPARISGVAWGDARAPAQRALARHQADAHEHPRLAAYAAALLLIAALTPFQHLWFAETLLVLLLLTIPGMVLLLALRVPTANLSAFPVYIPCASIVVLLASGLVVDLIGPPIGVSMPLRTMPLLVSLEIMCFGLLVTSVHAPDDVGVPWTAVLVPVRHTWPLILPVVAAAGALRLNNGHTNLVAVLALAACALVVVTALILSARLDEVLLAVILYSAQLAQMWAYSLRGSLVYGFDIATEYYDLHRTVLAGVWHAAHSNAYTAMLSVTIMPAELHFLSGVPDLMIFKVIYPLISSLFPVAVFGLARRVLSRSWAYAAAAFFVVQGAFSQELPAIARQEVALVLFAALVAAMLERQLRRWTQYALVSLLGLAMVLAHYSTTYVALTLIGLTLPLQWLASWIRDVPRITGAVLVSFLVPLIGAVVWYGPVTHSTASGLEQLAQSVQTQGFNVLPNQARGQNWLSTYLQGNSEASISAEQYAQLVHTYYSLHVPYVKPLPDAGLPQYSLHNSSPPTPPVKYSAAYSAISFGSVAVQQIVYVLGAVGALLMLLRRKASVVTRQLALLGLGTLLILVLIRLSGTIAAAYNQERALLQATVILDIMLCWSLQSFLSWKGQWRASVLVCTAAGLAIMFISTTGLIGTVLGGGTATNLANSGDDFESFYMTSTELASAQWLGRFVRPGQLVYADRYAQLPLVAMTGISTGLVGDVTPLTINQHAWIYASSTNIVDRRSRALLDDHSVTYTFPAGFLGANYDLVYTDGSSEVFHR